MLLLHLSPHLRRRTKRRSACFLLKLSLNELYCSAARSSSMSDHSSSVAKPCFLSELGIGCRGCVVSVGGDPEVKRRLLEMGFCNGACVEVVRRAPLRDPIEFRLRGYFLSLC